VAGGAMIGGTMMAVDRRTTGAQVDDQTIDLRTSSAITAAIGDRGHVNASSYNRVVLLTGEVPTDADRAKVEAAVAKVENVRAVVNELAVMPNSSLGGQTNDTIITGKVKAAFLDAKELQVASIKVITERGVVFLMGRVTENESNIAAQVARSVGGVQKVVKVFEIITPAELAAMPVPPTPAASAPGK
jgi:osmotically-inducible protein OsmY